MKVAVLGNGPSLNTQSFSYLLSTYDKIISCNRIYLHNDYHLISSICSVFVSDKTLLSVLRLNKNLIPTGLLYTPSHAFNMTDNSFVLDRRNKSAGSITNALSNCLNYPYVIETSSIITTACLPYCFSLGAKQIDLYGVDKSYYTNDSDFVPYFYKKQENTGYSWGRQDASHWSIHFSLEIQAQLKFINQSVRFF